MAILQKKFATKYQLCNYRIPSCSNSRRGATNGISSIMRILKGSLMVWILWAPTLSGWTLEHILFEWSQKKMHPSFPGKWNPQWRILPNRLLRENPMLMTVLNPTREVGSNFVVSCFDWKSRKHWRALIHIVILQVSLHERILSFRKNGDQGGLLEALKAVDSISEFEELQGKGYYVLTIFFKAGEKKN